LHTKLSNPRFAPEVQAETCLVNFTCTEAGLEEQLLAVTVRRERPDLAAQKGELIKQSNAFKIRIKELEDGILRRLAEAEGDLTEDRALIESLEDTKRVAADITTRSAVAARTTAEINATSEVYRPVAHRAALLFFIMVDLPRLHTYYTYSLSAFVTTFLRSMAAASGGAASDEAGTGGASAGAALVRTGSAGSEDDLDADMAAEEEGYENRGTAAAAVLASHAASAEATGGAIPSGVDAAPPLASPEPPPSTAAAACAAPPPTARRRRGRGCGGGATTPAAFVLSGEALEERCRQLVISATETTFSFIARGLFERDKLTVAALLCMRVQQDAGELPEHLVRALLLGPAGALLGSGGGGGGGDSGAPTPDLPASPAALPAALEWLPEALWLRVRGLEALRPGPFERLGEDMVAETVRWRAWFDAEKPEAAPLPGAYRVAVGAPTPFALLLLLRTLRPDRLTASLAAYVGERLGAHFVLPRAFDMAAAHAESSPSAPIFFVLFPGVDPTAAVESLGRSRGLTADSGRFKNISMGQGQEAPASATLARLAAEGGWVMLQNVHLMQSWLPALERQLEELAAKAHPDFRVFISAEPPPLPGMANMPESLLQACVKVANEAPADLHSNLERSWAAFSQDAVDASADPAAFKACLLTLCWYHAVVLGRRRFGQQGWSRKYSFNNGDLTVCANVLAQLINARAAARASICCARTLAQTVRSPLLKAYLRDQPCWPKRRRPRTTAWYQHSATKHALKAAGSALASTAPWPKAAHARARLERRSAGASLATLTHVCSSDSGMLAMPGSGGGSAEMKTRNSGCATAASSSSCRSSAGSQPCMRCTFCSMTQPPPAASRASVAMAGASWPWPMEMFLKRPLSAVRPRRAPSASTAAVGSTPGKSTKKTGAAGDDSACAAAMSKGRACTKCAPSRSPT
jgi:dynein heavy chain